MVVRIDPRYFRPAKVETLLADPSRAKEKLGWTPTSTLEELVAEMVAADRDDAQKEAFLKRKVCGGRLDGKSTDKSSSDQGGWSCSVTPLITPSDLNFVAGHRGMAGSAISHLLYNQLLTAGRSEPALLDGPAVEDWLAEHHPRWWCLPPSRWAVSRPTQLSSGLSAGEPQDPDPCDRNSMALGGAAPFVSRQ